MDVRLVQSLFFLNAAIWLFFGLVSLVRMAGGGPGQTATAAVVAVLMFGNVGVMLVSGVGLGTRQRRFYYLALSVLCVNILLTFTDEFGLFDLLTLVLDVALLGLLIVNRQCYLHPEGVAPSS